VRQQLLVATLELTIGGKVVDRCRQTVTTNALGDAPEEIHRILQSLSQRFKRLGVARMDMFPVGIGEHGVKQQMVKWLTSESDTEFIQIDEVKGQHVSRMMNLREGDFLRDVLVDFPRPDSSFERAANIRGDRRQSMGRILSSLLQPLQQRIRLELWIGFQLCFDERPVGRQRIGTGPIDPRLFGELGGKLIEYPIFTDGVFAHP
jgi:hypothetical protein